MKSHHFVVVATGGDPDADETYNAFYEAGCADATVCWSDGAFALTFARQAAGFDEALTSAYRDVTAAGATVIRFEPDSLVSLEDIAERSGLTLAKIGELRVSEGANGFPAPKARVTSHEPLWDWAEVAIWLQHRELVQKDIAIQARLLWEANTTLLLQAVQGVDFVRSFSSLQA